MQQGEMPGCGRRALLPHSSPTAWLLLAGSSSKQNKEALACTRVVHGNATRSHAIKVTGKPISRSFPGWLPRAGQQQQQARAGNSFKDSPALAADTQQDQPYHPCTLWGRDPGSQDELPPPSAFQTVTQAPDQRPTSVEYPFCLHSVSHALIIVLIKAVLILTSPLVPPLSCSDLIVFLAVSASAPATKSHPLHSQQAFPAPLGSLD